ncbi:MAG: hypothetical protein LBQ75_01355 [Zoogloeaceae bacterium]|jgi:hypothetical protein|nr:hypothetical protein [Zoogloeaceae bacterium]
MTNSSARFEAEISNLNAMNAKIQAEHLKLVEEIRKNVTEPKWYPLAYAGLGAIIAAIIVAFAKIFLP